MNISSVTDLIERFGGIGPMADALDVHYNTVRNWPKRGSIPPKNAPAIATAAKKRGIRIKLEDVLRLSVPNHPTS